MPSGSGPRNSYAIGVAKPLSVFVETNGMERGALAAEDITDVINIAFDCRPGAIALSLSLMNQRARKLQPIATSAGSQSPKTESNSLSGECQGLVRHRPGAQSKSQRS